VRSFVTTVIFLSTLLFGGCQSKPASSKPAALTGYPQILGATPLLTGGYNRSAVFSLDGTKVYFISKNRRDHRNTQAYEYDLAKGTERRITFQDGEVLTIAPAPDQKIYYSSNTDEIKEAPFAAETDARFARAEIYSSDPFGEEIDRVTTSPGFDGEMVYLEAKKRLLFTSVRSGQAGLYWLQVEGNVVTPFQVTKRLTHAPALSPKGDWVFWVEEEPRGTLPNGKASPLVQTLVRSTVLGRDRTELKAIAGVVKSLSVNGTGLIAYAWQPNGSEFNQIDLFNPETNCNRTLVKSKMDFLEPAFSPKNPNLLLFRGAFQENSVIYRWELPEGLGPCVP
jgi:hypothetical protein